MGGEGNIINIDGLEATEPPISMITSAKIGQEGPRISRKSAIQKFAHLGKLTASSINPINDGDAAQLKKSPRGKEDDFNDDSRKMAMSNEEIDLKRSDLFTIKLEIKGEKNRRQCHLQHEEFKLSNNDVTTRLELSDTPLSQPNMNPNHDSSTGYDSDAQYVMNKPEKLGVKNGGGTDKVIGLKSLKNNGVKEKIEAFELLNEGQRRLKLEDKQTPDSSKKTRKLNIKGREAKKGGALRTPSKGKSKFKPQKHTLKHYWGPEDN